MITVEFNDAEVSAAFDRITAHLTDMSDLMNEVGMFLVASTEKRFDQTEAPDGSKWAPRSPVTIAHYKRTGQKFGPVLYKSGELRRSIHHQYDATSVTIGTNVLQSAVMQFGARAGAFGVFAGYVPADKKMPEKGTRFHMHAIPWGNIPARPFIGISGSDRTNLIETVQEWLAGIASP